MSEHPDPGDKRPVDSLHERRSTERGKDRFPAADNEGWTIEYILDPENPCEIRVRMLDVGPIPGNGEEGLVLRTAEEATYFLRAIGAATAIGRRSRNVKARNTERD